MRVVIIGGGFAGIATAYHLARRGESDVLVIEREEGPGMHASGRNAGLLRQSSSDESVAAMLRRGSAEARAILGKVPGGLDECGSLILGGGVDNLQRGAHARVVDAAEMVPGLSGRALFDPDDALMDPLSLLNAYLDEARAAGVRTVFGETVTAIETGPEGATGVRTDRATHTGDRVVIAAGAWSAEVARLAGSRAIHIEPRRRHLFRAQLEAAEKRRYPFVWDDSEGVYFRAEGDEMILSPCDVEVHPAASPEVDPAQRDRLAEKVEKVFGALGDWRIGRGWACLRSFAPDERFVIGNDPDVARLFWVAGLGGHGVTSSWAVGDLAASILCGEVRDGGPFDPARFAGEAPA